MSVNSAFQISHNDTNWYTHAKHAHHDLISYIYENHLTQETMPNIDRRFVHQNTYGWTALAFDVAGMSRKPAGARSIPSLLYKIDKQGYQYYRPNLSYTSTSHRKRDLRWLVTLVFDFDAENLSALKIESHEELINYVESFDYQVCGVVRTTSGYHVYLPMQSLRGSWGGEKTIHRYDHVIKRIARQLGSDPAAASAEHYFRTPQKDNVVYFCPVDKPQFDFYEQKVKAIEEKSFKNEMIEVSFGRMMSQPAMQKLLAGDFNQTAAANTENGVRRVGRNNAAFTLALGMKFDGWSIEQATAEIGEWFHDRINRQGLTWSEVERAIRHAFQGDYKGPSPRYVEAFTGIKLHPITRRKSSEERVRIRFEETEERLIAYLQRYYVEFEKDLMMSQAKLAENLGVKPRSLQHVLKSLQERGLLDLQTKREGRSYVSIYFLAAELLSKEEANTEATEPSNNELTGGTAMPDTAERSAGEETGQPESQSSRVPDIHSAISCTYFLRAIGPPEILILDSLVMGIGSSRYSPSGPVVWDRGGG